MNSNQLKLSPLTLAIQVALAAMVVFPTMAHADDDEVAELVNPTSVIQTGIAGVSADSTKFGEYNGLHKKGAYGVLDADLRGGDSYGQGTGVRRWSVTGSNIGTGAGSAEATISNQGEWNLGVGFDELHHYTTTNYQTPYQQGAGSNVFTLPSNFGVINSSQSTTGAVASIKVGNTTTYYNNLVGARSLTSTQLGAFQTQDVSSNRQNIKFNAGYNFDRRLNLRFDYNHLEQTGAKLIGAGTDGVSSNFANSAQTWTKEAIMVLMNPTKYQTDTFNTALNWSSEDAHGTVGYFMSIFHDDYRGVTWDSPFQTTQATGTASAFPTSTMSTPPSNIFHQLNFSGGYKLSPDTKLASNFSYGINTQNEPYSGTYTNTAASPTASNLPGSSLGGKVVISHFDVKLTNQAAKDLQLIGGVKFNERDNQTSSNLYTYVDEGVKTRQAWNTPQSNRKTQVEMAGEYKLSANERVRLGYDWDKVERWCNNSPSLAQIQSAYSFTGTTFTTANQTAAAAYYAGGTSCAQVPQSEENRLSATYRNRTSDEVSMNASLSFGDRHADVNTAFYNPMQSVTEGFENPGFVAFFQSSRRDVQVKAGTNWQANEKLDIGLSAKYRQDNYYGMTYGVGEGYLASVNLDAAYAYSDRSSVTSYVTVQNRSRTLNTESGRIPVAGTATSGPWSNKLQDQDVSLGVTGKQQGLLAGKLDLMENFNYSWASTSTETNLNYATAPAGCTSAVSSTILNYVNQACGSPPDVRSELIQLRLSGNYHLDKESSIVMAYAYQKLLSRDYYYNPYQYPNNFTTGLPTNQSVPSYQAYMAYVGYQYKFR